MYVIKETAHKLEAAGFPQDGESGAFYFPDNLGGGFVSPCSEIAGTQSQFPGAVYAPNIVELLEVMKDRCFIGSVDGQWRAYLKSPLPIAFHSENPAEALAEAYLHINQPIEA